MPTMGLTLLRSPPYCCWGVSPGLEVWSFADELSVAFS